MQACLAWPLVAPPDRDQQPTHPTLIAALLMLGVAVALVLIAVVDVTS